MGVSSKDQFQAVRSEYEVYPVESLTGRLREKLLIYPTYNMFCYGLIAGSTPGYVKYSAFIEWKSKRRHNATDCRYIINLVKLE